MTQHEQWLLRRLEAYATFTGTMQSVTRTLGDKLAEHPDDMVEIALNEARHAFVRLDSALAERQINYTGSGVPYEIPPESGLWRCSECGLPSGQRCPDCKEVPPGPPYGT